MANPALAAGGLATTPQQSAAPARQLTLLQRTAGKLGAGQGKTTGWIHRTALKHKHMELIGGANHERIADKGLLVTYGKRSENPTWIACDTVVLFAAQLPLRPLAHELAAAGRLAQVTGGALEAGELDAKRAIDQTARLAAKL